MNLYCITFPNGKKYLGVESITGNRKCKHARAKYNSSNQLVSRAIRKYGWENCNFEYILKDQSPEECFSEEIRLIATWDLQNPNKGYNQSIGGEKGFKGVKMSDEHKKKIGDAHKNKIVTKDTRDKLRKANLGKKLNNEIKDKIRKSLIGRISGMKGKVHSLETKSKISNSLKGSKNPFFGKKHSKETIANIIASNKRRSKNAS